MRKTIALLLATAAGVLTFGFLASSSSATNNGCYGPATYGDGHGCETTTTTEDDCEYESCDTTTTTAPTTTTTEQITTTTVPETTTTTETVCTGDPLVDPSGCPINDCLPHTGYGAECDTPDITTTTTIPEFPPDYAG